MQPLLLLYAKMLQCWGWNSAEVMTCKQQAMDMISALLQQVVCG
jgi:hypothetical protein